MGIYYSFALKVGYSVSMEEFDKLFRITDEGKFHWEDRFDPKTGKKINQEKIWDQRPRSHYQIGEDTFDSIFTICYEANQLEKKLECSIDMTNANGEIVHFTLAPPHKLNKVEYGNDTLTPGPISLNTLQEMLPKLLEIKTRLEALGLQPGDPEVFVSSWAG